jgi:DNA-directed RNA polymerase specialized sigma24 family protein
MPPLTRVTLIQKLQRGEGWEDFYKLYAPMFFHYALRNGCDDSTAGDLTSETTLAVFKRIARYELRDGLLFPPKKAEKTLRQYGYRFSRWLFLQAREQLRELRQSERRAHDHGMVGTGSEEVYQMLDVQPDERWRSDWKQRIHDLAEDEIKNDNPADFRVYSRIFRELPKGACADPITTAIAKRIQQLINERFVELYREWGDDS